MEVIKFQGSGFVPGITLDKENNLFEITGRACPEDPVEFYKPVFEWLEKYATEPNGKTVFNFKLTYYNTATSKVLMMLLQKLEELKSDGNDVLIRWHYPDDDEDMQEAGEDYAEMVEIPFEMVSYEE